MKNKQKLEYFSFNDKSKEVNERGIDFDDFLFSDNQLGSSMISFRLGLLQYGYSCKQMPSFVMRKEFCLLFILIIIRLVF
jgi:hypothetical protein